MKATLEFQLPEEQEEFELARNAGKYSSAFWDLTNDLLRQVWKYNTLPEELATHPGMREYVLSEREMQLLADYSMAVASALRTRIPNED